MSKQQHEWAYKQQDSDTEIGPVTESQLLALVKNGIIVGSTLVRSPTRTKNKWVAVKRIPAVAKLLLQPNERPATHAVTAQPPTNGPPMAGDLAATGKPAENPYAAPVTDKVVSQSTGSPTDAKTILEKFKPLNSKPVTWLLRATMLTMAINGVCILFFILYGYSKVPSIAVTQMGVFALQLFLSLVTVIFFLQWKYRAYSNLQAACANKLKTSAGWVVAVYFIPIVMLFRPAMAMHEIQSRSKAGVGSSVLGWWILVILASICGRVSFNAPSEVGLFVLALVSICLMLVAGYLLLKIIRTVTEKQRRYRLYLEVNSN